MYMYVHIYVYMYNIFIDRRDKKRTEIANAVMHICAENSKSYYKKNACFYSRICLLTSKAATYGSALLCRSSFSCENRPTPWNRKEPLKSVASKASSLFDACREEANYL